MRNKICLFAGVRNSHRNCFLVIFREKFVIKTSNLAASIFTSKISNQQNIRIWALPKVILAVFNFIGSNSWCNSLNLFRITHIYISDCNGIRTKNHLVRKRTPNHLTKRFSVCSRTKWLWLRIALQSLKLQISRLFRARSSLTFRQL